MYVYIESEKGLYTVGHYDPKGKWIPESDHSDREKAAARVAWLNGGQQPVELEPI
jgi:hypothetical protein